jgi:ribosomal protein S16
MKTKLTLISLILLTAFQSVHADELMLSIEEAVMLGYKPYEATIKASPNFVLQDSAQLQALLKWPFEAPYAKSYIGNNFVQFQPYGKPGYHMGDDMLLESGSWAFAPVAGRVEAGHYGYTDLPNGNRIKQWIAWPGRGDDNYFEIAVIDGNGTRYELHHVDRYSMPNEVIEALKSNGSVQAGQRLGQVVPWSTPFHYVHVHLNVFNAMGTAINPESIFEVIPDSIAPNVSFLALYQDGSTEWLSEGAQITKPVTSFIVSGADKKDLHEYVQAIPYVEFAINGAIINSLDFRHSLLDGSGIFTDIREVYLSSLRLSDRTILRQPTDFYPVAGTKFHQQLMVNRAPTGQPFQLKVQDMAGNATVLNGRF